MTQYPQYRPYIDAYSALYGVDPNLLERMMHTESRGKPNAVSPVGAQGLMQLMPATQKQVSVTDPFNPVQNIRGGAQYLSWLQKQFPNDPFSVQAAYNWGIGNVQRKGLAQAPQETQDYAVQNLGVPFPLARPGSQPQQRLPKARPSPETEQPSGWGATAFADAGGAAGGAGNANAEGSAEGTMDPMNLLAMIAMLYGPGASRDRRTSALLQLALQSQGAQ